MLLKLPLECWCLFGPRRELLQGHSRDVMVIDKQLDFAAPSLPVHCKEQLCSMLHWAGGGGGGGGVQDASDLP